MVIIDPRPAQHEIEMLSKKIIYGHRLKFIYCSPNHNRLCKLEISTQPISLKDTNNRNSCLETNDRNKKERYN